MADFFSPNGYKVGQLLSTNKVVENANDKPWDTEELRRVIRRRQYSLTHGRFDDQSPSSQ